MFSRCLPLTQSPGLLNVCNIGDDNITHNDFKESVSEEKGDKRTWLAQWPGGWGDGGWLWLLILES